MREPIIEVDRLVEKHLDDETKRIIEARRNGKPFWAGYHPAKAANFLMMCLNDEYLDIEEKRAIYKSMIPQIRQMSDKDKDRIRERCAELKEEAKNGKKWTCGSCYKTISYPPIMVEDEYEDRLLCRQCAGEGEGLFTGTDPDGFNDFLAEKWKGKRQ